MILGAFFYRSLFVVFLKLALDRRFHGHHPLSLDSSHTEHVLHLVQPLQTLLVTPVIRHGVPQIYPKGGNRNVALLSPECILQYLYILINLVAVWVLHDHFSPVIANLRDITQSKARRRSSFETLSSSSLGSSL